MLADHLVRALCPKQPSQEGVDVGDLPVRIGHAKPLRCRFDEPSKDRQFLLSVPPLFHFGLQQFVGFGQFSSPFSDTLFQPFIDLLEFLFRPLAFGDVTGN